MIDHFWIACLFYFSAPEENVVDLTPEVAVVVDERYISDPQIGSIADHECTACRNRAYDHLKKAGHDKKYREYLFRYWGQPGNEVRPEVERTIEAAHYRKVLEQSLKDLPDQQRIIFNLSKKEGLTHKQIAEKLDISPLTVRNHLRRALINIRATAHPDVELVLFLCFLMF